MTQDSQRLCGSRVFNSKNCHNKIRKVAQNKFERVYLCGKHAFNYSVITENLIHNNLQETTFTTRKAALCFFMLTLNRYK